ncbi:uncharacterized protein [Chiloscyllium punctatum]|uniref:uncharacterized protein isoform X2 n=1 Tax=Chiloscyllium punctatum TaxID=137246 RepID=UPI003B63FAED
MNDLLALKVLLVSFSLTFRPAAGRKEVFGVRGSSILLDPEYTDDLTHRGIVWTFNGSTRSLVNIVDYVPGYYKVEPSKQFQSRLHYNPSNGSLLLKNLQPHDQGVYTFAVDENWKMSANLRLIERHYLTKGLSIAVAAVVVTTSIITCRIAFCSNAEKRLYFLKYGLQIMVYVLLIALFAYWIAVGETSTIVLVMLVVLCLLLILTVLLLMASFGRFKETLKSKTCILTVLGVLAMSGEIAVLCLTASLIAEVTSPVDKGCELAAKLRSNFTIAAYVSIAFLLAFILRTILTKWNKRRLRNQPPNLDANNVDVQQEGELIDQGKEKL